MPRATVSSAEHAQLQRLYAQLPAAVAQAAQALQTGGAEFTPKHFEQFRERDEAVNRLIAQIWTITEGPQS